MRGDAARLVAEQVLTIFHAHPGRPQATPEGVLEIMHTNAPEALRAGFAHHRFVPCRRPLPYRLPGRVQDLGHAPSPEGEHVRRMHPSLFVNDGSGHTIQHDQPVFLVLDELFGDDEDTGLKFRNLTFPLPAESHHLLFAGAGVHLEESHSGQVRLQLPCRAHADQRSCRRPHAAGARSQSRERAWAGVFPVIAPQAATTHCCHSPLPKENRRC